MTQQQTPLARFAARNEWQGGNRGGIQWPNLPPRSMLRAWETKMNPAVFDANGWARRASRRTRGERLAVELAVIAAVLAFCAIVWTVVWGVMA